MAEKKEEVKDAPKEQGNTHAPMDPKKKKILIGAGAFGVLVLGYLYYKNQSSSSSTTPTSSNPNTSGLVSYVTPTGGSGSGSPITINNTNTNAAAGGTGGGATMGGGITGGQLPITSVPNKGGKTHLHKVVKKHGVKISGGTGRVSGTTATQRTLNIRAANQRKIANQRAANQRRAANQQHAVVTRHFNHVARPSHSFTTGTAPHNIAIRPPHHAAPRHYGHPGYTHF